MLISATAAFYYLAEPSNQLARFFTIAFVAATSVVAVSSIASTARSARIENQTCKLPEARDAMPPGEVAVTSVEKR